MKSAMCEVMMGRRVERHSPARLGPKALATVQRMMKEVHEDEPSTVTRANVSGTKKEAMLQAIAFSKARAAGARVPKKKGR